MKTIFLYATKYGCVEQCGKRIEEKLGDQMDFINLKSDPRVDLTQYDCVILGGSIYIGRIQKEITKFVLENIKILNNKKLGLFICCLKEGEEAKAELETTFPDDLLEHATAKDYFGGQVTFQKLNFLERLIMKKVAKTDHDICNILNDKIDHFVHLLKSENETPLN